MLVIPSEANVFSAVVDVDPSIWEFTELFVSLKSFVPTVNDGFCGIFGFGICIFPINDPISSVINLTSITEA